MVCDDFENRILEMLDTQVSSAGRDLVEAHLSECAHCQEFARHIHLLDGRLKHGIAVPTLSIGFESRLRQRLESETSIKAGPMSAALRHQLEVEYQENIKKLRRQYLGWHSLWTSLRFAVLTACSSWLLLKLLLLLPNVQGGSGFADSGRNLAFIWALGAVSLLFGLALAFPRKWKRMSLLS